MSASKKPSGVPASLRVGPVNPSSSFLRTGVAASVSTLLLAPMVASAQAPTGNERTSTVVVEGTRLDPNPNAEPGAPYKARTSGDERHTRPLSETPQTITVLTKTQIDDSGYTALRDIVDAQPGITVGTGENGNAFGDRYIIRGQEARSDVFVDGLRDPGMTTRESFAIEQLEISKGPNSSFAGRGTAGGAVNAITKAATPFYDFLRIAPSFGSDDYVRVTLDANQTFGDSFAVRANALYSSEEVPDRAPAERNRNGLALSGLYEPTDALSIVLDYYGMRADDRPDLGSYLVGAWPDRVPESNPPAYAQQQDFLDSDVDTTTARIKYQINDAWRITNLTRYGTSDNGYVVTGAGATTTNAFDPNGIYNTVTLSTHQSWQDVEYLANQANLFFNTNILGRPHQFIFSLEYTDHSVLNGVYNVTNTGQNCVTGTSPTATTLNSWCVVGPNGNLAGGLDTFLNRQIAKGTWDLDWNVETTAASIMDTFDITDRWTAFGGIRADHFDFALTTQSPTTLAQADYRYSDTMINGHVGLTYDLTAEGIVYASVGTSSDINGGESDVGTNSGYGGIILYNGSVAGADPERSLSLELGTKWDLFDDKLLLTAALFQSTKSDVMEGANYDSIGTFNSGKNRTRGVEFGLAGNITETLSAQAAVAFLDSEILESATPASVGKVLSNFADTSVSAQVKYQITPDLAIGAAGKYEGEKYGGQPDTAAVFGTDPNLPGFGEYSQPVPDYTVFDVFATYNFNVNMDMRLNIGNITDEDYYTAVYRSGRFLYKGDARTIRLSFTYAL